MPSNGSTGEFEKNRMYLLVKYFGNQLKSAFFLHYVSANNLCLGQSLMSGGGEGELKPSSWYRGFTVLSTRPVAVACVTSIEFIVHFQNGHSNRKSQGSSGNRVAKRHHKPIDDSVRCTKAEHRVMVTVHDVRKRSHNENRGGRSTPCDRRLNPAVKADKKIFAKPPFNDYVVVRVSAYLTKFAAWNR